MTTKDLSEIHEKLNAIALSQAGLRGEVNAIPNAVKLMMIGKIKEHERDKHTSDHAGRNIIIQDKGYNKAQLAAIGVGGTGIGGAIYYLFTLLIRSLG